MMIYVVLQEYGIGQDRLTRMVKAFADEEKANRSYIEKQCQETNNTFYVEKVFLET